MTDNPNNLLMRDLIQFAKDIVEGTVVVGNGNDFL